jgi:Trk K+ transport system NAD-binding subunit
MLVRGKKFLLAVFSVLLFYFLMLEFLEGWSAIDTTWFLIATISTVGYGDKVPQDELGRLLVIILIIISIISIATLSTILFETINTITKPQFWNEYTLREVKHHVIIVGDNNLSAIIADTFIEIGITPVILDTTVSIDISTKYLSVTGELRSAETFVKAKIESQCLGVIITSSDDTEKINAAITVRSINSDISVLIVLEIRRRLATTRPLPATIFSDLNLTVIDPAVLLANEISNYLHVHHFKKESKDFLSMILANGENLYEFPADALIIPTEAVEFIQDHDLDIELLGFSRIGTADFTVGYPDQVKDREISHLLLVGHEINIDNFRRSFCTLNAYQMPKKTLILGFGETSKVLLPVLTETETNLTVLDIHENKIQEAKKKFKVENVINDDFFDLYGLYSTEPFDFDLTIINMPKILAMAALARIKVISPKTRTVVTVPDIIDAPYFYSHGASLVLVRSQLTAEAALRFFFDKTHFFGNGLLEFISDVPTITIKDLESNLKGQVLAIYSDEHESPKFIPFRKNLVINKNNKIMFFHESFNIARAKYGH